MLRLDKGKAIFAPALDEQHFLKFWEQIVDGTMEVQPLANVLVKYFTELVIPNGSSLSIAFTFWDNDPVRRIANLVGGFGLNYSLAKYPKRQSYGQGIVGSLLSRYEHDQNAKPYVSCDCSKDPHLVASDVILKVYKFQSVIAFPVFIQGTLTGILKLYCGHQLDESVQKDTARLQLENRRLSFLLSLVEHQFAASMRKNLAARFQYIDVRLPESNSKALIHLLKNIVKDCLEETISVIGAQEGRISLRGRTFSETTPLSGHQTSTNPTDHVSLELLTPSETITEGIGVFEVRNKLDGTYFSRLDRNLLEVAAQAFSKYLSLYLAMSDEAMIYHRKLDHQKHLLEASKSVSLKLVSTSSEEETIEALLASVKQNFLFDALVFFKVERSSLVPYQSDPPSVVSRLAQANFDLDIPDKCALAEKPDWGINDCPSCRICKGLTVIAALRRTYIQCADLRRFPYGVLHADFEVVNGRAEFIIPIVAHDTLYGVLDLYRREATPIEENEWYFLQAICNSAALSFHNRQLFDTLANIQAQENRGEMAREVVHTMSPISASMMIYFRLLDKSVNAIGGSNFDKGHWKQEIQKMTARLENLREALRQQQNLIQHYATASSSSENSITDVNISSIIDDVIEINSYKASSKKILIKHLAIGKARTIRAVTTDLYLILWNLVNNAIKFTRGGKPTTISITERYDSSAVTISIRDEGVGISEEDRPHIWDLGFSKIAPGEKKPTSGVGLATVKDLVTMIERADIQVRSRLNSWTEFTLTIAQKG